MSDVNAGTVVIVALLGVMSFMGRRYFYRVEGHLAKNHEMLSTLTAHGLKLGDHERRIRKLESKP